jgi:hypothetical protein
MMFCSGLKHVGVAISDGGQHHINRCDVAPFDQSRQDTNFMVLAVENITGIWN